MSQNDTEALVCEDHCATTEGFPFCWRGTITCLLILLAAAIPALILLYSGSPLWESVVALPVAFIAICSLLFANGMTAKRLIAGIGVYLVLCFGLGYFVLTSHH